MLLISMALALQMAHAQLASSCFTTAHQFHTAERSAQICRNVGSGYCFSEAYRYRTLERAADACRNVHSDL
ncbi:MAG: hypothetical protein ACK45V_00025, partial [Brevundimonas sp.]